MRARRGTMRLLCATTCRHRKKPPSLAVVYAVLVLPRLGAIWPAVSRPTLDGIAALLGSSAGATNVVVISFIVEMTAIITQAARGTTSHFNMTTPFNSLVWMTMGTFIVLVWVMTLLLAVLLIQQRLPDRALAWSLRLGVLISVVGMCVAFLMVRPTPAQVAALTTLHGPHIIGAHSVGIPDGGPGLPFLGGAPWRATCGPHISSGYTPCSSCLF